MIALATCPGCGCAEVGPSAPVCAYCADDVRRAATHESDCRCAACATRDRIVARTRSARRLEVQP